MGLTKHILSCRIGYVLNSMARIDHFRGFVTNRQRFK